MMVLKGQFSMTEMDGSPALLFMGSPAPSSIEEMMRCNLYLSDFPSHDLARDRVLLREKLEVRGGI